MTIKNEANIFFLKNKGNAEIYIKRDDRIPFSFGGNKVRIARELISDMKKRGFDSIISYGSPASNMNRAVAHAALSDGIPCRVIIKSQENGGNLNFSEMPLNEKLVRASGAVVSYCGTDNVKEAVEEAAEAERLAGRKAYYIYGNSFGTGNKTALMMASFKEYGEIRRFERESGTEFDHIFLAVGTGATVSGLTAGERTEIIVSENKNLKVPQIHGISVARTAEREREVILDNLYSFNPAVMDPEADGFDISDEYLCGGYGQYDDAVMKCIKEMLFDYGIPLDPTYTGKAYYGTEREIEKRNLSGRCLFIHTGGYPLFADMAGFL